MKTFTSFWLLCSPVKGNFILMCADGKSVKVIAVYQQLHEVWDTVSLALQLIKSTAVRRWLLALCAGEHGDPRAATAPTAASPHRCPGRSERGPKKPHSTRKVNMSTKTHSCFSWWDTCDGRKATRWPAGSFPDLCPCRTWESFSSNQLSFTNSYTHTKTTLQKHIPINSSECLKMNQLTRNISNRNSNSCVPPENVLKGA